MYLNSTKKNNFLLYKINNYETDMGRSFLVLVGEMNMKIYVF